MFHRSRKLQLVGIRQNHLNDFIGSNAAMIQFAAWSLYRNVLCIEPDFVTYLEYRYRLTLTPVVDVVPGKFLPVYAP